MKILKYIGVLLVMTTIITSCNKELENPALSGNDLVIFYKNSGQKPVWEEFEILKGDSVQIDLMVSPSEGTSVQWLDMADTSVVSTNEFSYKFIGNDLGKYRRVFEAEKEGVVVKSTFNFSVLGDTIGSAASVPNDYVTKKFSTGAINVSFSVDYDVTPKGDKIDGYVALSGSTPSNPNDHGGMSTIIRFTSDGVFDARNGDAYTKDTDISYFANETYHVRMDVDVVNQKYSVWISDKDGVNKQLAADYTFRAKYDKLKYWNLWSASLGLHTVRNFSLTNVVVSNTPVFDKILPIEIFEGGNQTVKIKAFSPTGGNIEFSVKEGEGLRFVELVDNGNGKADLIITPYSECGGCDMGDHQMTIVATDESGSTEQVVDVSVTPYFVDVKADAADATVFANGEINAVYEINYAGYHGIVDFASTIIPIKIPTEEGKIISAADLSLYISNNVAWMDLKYDLYAIGIRDTPEALATDYYTGDYNGDATSEGIQEGFIAMNDPVDPPAGSPVLRKSSEQGSIALGEYLKTKMAEGDISGKYLLLRLSVNRSDIAAWNLLQTISADATDEAMHPVLRIKY